MQVRRLDDNWDFCFGRGSQNYISGIEAVGQAIKQRLLLLYAEWWEDLKDGLPLWEQILGTSGSEESRFAPVKPIARSFPLFTCGKPTDAPG